MRVTHRRLSGVASLGLLIILAACAQPAAVPSSPSAPADSPAPTEQPSQSPSSSPTEEPSPTPEVTEHELPMTGRVTESVDVRELPSLDARVLIGQRMDDLSDVEVRLEADALVLVDVGPVVNDGLSWYRVGSMPEGADVHFGLGWIPGESLAREADYLESPEVTAIFGVGSGTAASTDVLMGTPVSVAFAAAPLAGDESCEAEVTLIRTDGTAVNVATETPTEAMAFEVGADTHGTGLQSLFQEEAGQITLQVRSDCAFAASAITPAG